MQHIFQLEASLMKNILNTTALAATLVLGGYGVAFAQGSGTAPHATGMGQQGSGMTQPGAQTQGSAGATQATRMNEEQIRTLLGARGYSDFENMERDGDTFRIASAERYGKEVEDLRVDARTGRVQDEARLTEDQARKLLENRGYSEISDVSRDDDTITAKAKQNDREVRLRIDAETGVVTQQMASN
ncbi:hypothetical protein [Falsiroseomonas sp.]|uniref:hypothetical protein n=1 Tax=Falsiroseomonas sp. TaxID=2870721 RepID=UPI002717769D|nr:hypothetical protein [Falsiroseomonas sp.]MDO9501815.1 hypothetical protein [Falsiroseomonas sp.]